MIAGKPHYTMTWFCGICGGQSGSFGTGPGMCADCRKALLPHTYEGVSFPYDGWDKMHKSYVIDLLLKFSDHDLIALYGFSQEDLTARRALYSLAQPANFVNLQTLAKRRALAPSAEDTVMVSVMEVKMPKAKKTISEESTKLMEMLFG